MAFNNYKAVKSFIPPLLKPLLLRDIPALDDWPDFLLWLDSVGLKFSSSKGGEADDTIFTVTRRDASGEGGEYISQWAGSLPRAIEKMQILFTLMDDPLGPLSQVEDAIKVAEANAAEFIQANLSKLT